MVFSEAAFPLSSSPLPPPPGWLGSLVLSQHACACACVAVGGGSGLGHSHAKQALRAVLAACTVLAAASENVNFLSRQNFFLTWRIQ